MFASIDFLSCLPDSMPPQGISSLQPRSTAPTRVQRTHNDTNSDKTCVSQPATCPPSLSSTLATEGSHFDPDRMGQVPVHIDAVGPGRGKATEASTQCVAEKLTKNLCNLQRSTLSSQRSTHGSLTWSSSCWWPESSLLRVEGGWRRRKVEDTPAPDPL